MSPNANNAAVLPIPRGPARITSRAALLAAALQRLNADYPQATVLFAGSGLPHMPEVLRAAGVTQSRPAV